MKKLSMILGVLMLISLVSGSSPALSSQMLWTAGAATSYSRIQDQEHLWVNPILSGAVITFQLIPPGVIGPPQNLPGTSPGPLTLYYSVPAISGNSIKADGISIKYTGMGAEITQVSVANGVQPILQQSGSWGAGGLSEIQLDLGGLVKFDQGLTVAITVRSNLNVSVPYVDPQQTMLQIVAVGARFNFNLQTQTLPAGIPLLLTE
jgi:hypothetical protein